MTLSNSKNFNSIESLNQFVLDLLLQTINDNPKASILLSGGSTLNKFIHPLDLFRSKVSYALLYL